MACSPALYPTFLRKLFTIASITTSLTLIFRLKIWDKMRRGQPPTRQGVLPPRAGLVHFPLDIGLGYVMIYSPYRTSHRLGTMA
jgi:hypothetical protein